MIEERKGKKGRGEERGKKEGNKMDGVHRETPIVEVAPNTS